MINLLCIYEEKSCGNFFALLTLSLFLLLCSRMFNEPLFSEWSLSRNPTDWTRIDWNWIIWRL